MFFHRSLFEGSFTDDQANLIAKMCNQYIDQNAKVFYGTLYRNGEAEGFGTIKKRKDTHVCLAIGIEEMGILVPSENVVAVSYPTREDVVRAQNDLINQLRREIATLRGKS